MTIKERLQIILITYNREKNVKKTFEQLYCENSPVKDCEILVLDNNSTDGTGDYIKELMKSSPNLRYEKNKYNVGLSGNIAKAMEIAEKDYVWIIGDDDIYYWENWNEVESAINNDEKVICIARYAIFDMHKHDIAHQMLQLTFITGGIYSTSLFNDTVMKNVFDNIYTIFPHLCPITQFINDNGVIYVVSNAISDNGMDLQNTDYSYTRGADNEGLYERSRSMLWIVGFANAISNLKNKKLKQEIFNTAILSKCIYGSWKSFYSSIRNTYSSLETLSHFIDVYIAADKKTKNKLLKNYFIISLKKKVKKLVTKKS